MVARATIQKNTLFGRGCSRTFPVLIGVAMEEILLLVIGVALYLLWLLLTATCKFIFRRVGSMWNGLTGETARRKKGEEEARKEEEERQQRQRERQRKRRQAEATEREQFRTENSEVFTGIRHLLSTCRAPAVEIMRAAGAIEGDDFERDPKLVVWTDVGFILACFRRTGCTGEAYIEMLWEAVTRTIRPPDVEGVPPLSVFENHGVKQLGMVSLLSEYDTQRGTNLTSKAASTYRSIVSAVYSHCDEVVVTTERTSEPTLTEKVNKLNRDVIEAGNRPSGEDARGDSNSTSTPSEYRAETSGFTRFCLVRT